MARRISSPLFIGREAELRAFDLALSDALEGRTGLLVLGGETGVGKSRLVAEFAARTRSRGGTAVVGTAPPPAGERRAPFAALTPALRGLLRSLDARLIDPLLGPARDDLAALLPELGPPVPPERPEHFTSARLAQAVLTTVEVVARHRGPVLLVIDDLHWADDATIHILAYLARNLADVAAVLLVTYRSDSLHEEGASLSVLAELSRFPAAEQLELGPLDAEEVGRQVQAILGGQAEAELTRALVRRSSGNPFFVEELLAAVIDGGIERPPPSVRAMTEARLGRLAPPSRRLVELTALAGGPSPAELLAAVTRMAPAAFDRALRSARDAGIIVVVEPHGGREGATGEVVDIRHELVREVVVGGISAPRRRELHRELAAAIERSPRQAGRTRLEQSSRLASHLLLAGETARAVRALLDEAAAAEEARSYIIAQQAYRRALDAWRSLESPVDERLDRAAVLERAARAASLAGTPAEAITLVEEALGALPSAMAAERDARLHLHLGVYQAAAGHGAAAWLTLQGALEGAPRGSLVASRIGTALARQLIRLGRATEGAERAAAAVGIAERLRARRELGQARSALAMALMSLGRTADALAALGPAADVVVGDGDGTTSPSRLSRYGAEVEGFLDRAWTLEQAGDPGAAARTALEGRQVADRLGLIGDARQVLSATAARDLLRTGAWNEADGLLDDRSDERGLRHPLVSIIRAHLGVRRGEWDVVDEVLTSTRPSSPGTMPAGWYAYARLVEAEAATLRRRFAAAREAVITGIVAAEHEVDRASTAELALLGMRIEADALAASGPSMSGFGATAEAQERAIELSIRLQGALGRDDDPSKRQRDRAMLATGMAELGRFPGPGAVESWAAAAAAADGGSDAYAAGYTHYRLGEALLLGPGDRVRARAELLTALRIADDLDARPLARDIEQVARRARLIGVVAERSGAPSTLPPGHAEARRLGLSEREIEVLALIAEGLPDREIASRLFISTKTAGHHVSHVLRKLDVGRRGEAAAVAFRIGLVPGAS